MSAGFNPRTRMIDTLAEELDEICSRMKRPHSFQSEKNFPSMSKSTSDYNSTRITNKSKFSGQEKSHYSKRNHLEDKMTLDQVETLPYLTKDRVHLDLTSLEQQRQTSRSNSQLKSSSQYSSSDEIAFDDSSINTVSSYDYLKTPVSPSKAVASFNSFANSGSIKDHKICFDTDLKSSFYGGSAFLTKCKDLKSQPSTGTGCLQKSYMTTDDSSGFSSDCTSSDITLQPTHRGMHRFVPRHQDELLIEIGDPVFVDYDSDDQWCQGTNLRTGQTGIFPNTHVFEIDLDPFETSSSNCDLVSNQKDTFYVTHLGSVEVAHHKGNDVLVQAIHKVLQAYQKKEDIVRPAPVLLDISFRGVHVIDKTKKNWFRCPNFDYFYSLQNISFCGAHPKQLNKSS